MTCELHLTNGGVLRGDYVDSIGISGEIARVWFILHDERRAGQSKRLGLRHPRRIRGW